MIMTEEEVCKEYLEAKNPSRHITVLSDLNVCQRSEIIDILVKHGLMTVPKQAAPKTPKPKNTKTKAEGKLLPKKDKEPKELPPEVCTALEGAMGEIEKEIKELEKRYRIIASFLWNGGCTND